MAQTRVSVIVPTYCPGEGLDRLVGSLDGQSMPADQFEVIFVDDGSTDDTYERLLALASSHPNYLVRRIDNSGWPSRPRNIGLGLAQGEYVLFMDHDDYLYPDGLRTAHEFAVTQRADVVSAKETRTSEWFAYEGPFQRDVWADAPKTPSHYGPWTTHKLFRREFLLEHGIRFREGRRTLFEDVLVGISAYVHAERLAILASQPFYQWVHSPGHNYSGTYGRDVGELLRSIGAIMDHAETEASGTPFADWVRGYQYGLRILGQLLGPGLLSRTGDKQAELVEQVRAFIEDHAPPTLDHGLNQVLGARAYLARRGDVDGLVALARADRGIKPIPVATTVEWDDHGALHIAVEVRWQDHSRRALLLRRDGDRLLRTLPADVPPLLDDFIDVTDWVPRAAAHLTVTDHQKTGWPADSSLPETTLEQVRDGHVTPVTRFDAVINRTGAELGRPLGPGVWNIACRASLNGYSGHQEVQFDDVARICGKETTVSTAHATAKGHLAVRFDGCSSDVLQLGRLDPRRASLSGSRWARAIHAPVDDARFTGSASLVTTAAFGPRDGRGPVRLREGRLIVDGDSARFELPVRLPRGSYDVREQVRGREEGVDLGIEVIVSVLGRIALRQRSAERSLRPGLRKVRTELKAHLRRVLPAPLTRALVAGRRRWFGG